MLGKKNKITKTGKKISKVKLIGDYKGIYYGHSKDEIIRKRASSGGIITSIISMMLRKGLANGVVVVCFNKEKPWLPEFSYIKTEEGAIKCMGSKYVKTELVDMIKLVDSIIKENPKERIIIVGLPCQTAYFRKAKKYEKNIVLIMGPFCGWNIDFEATEYLIKKAGCKNFNEIKEIDYRGGKYPGGFTVKCNKKTKSFKKYHYDLINLMFVNESCLSCNFYTNEAADISVGDAWIDEKNNSTIITRTDKGEETIKMCVNNNAIEIKGADVNDFFRQHKHNFMFKKKKSNIRIIKALHFIAYNLRWIIPFRLLSYAAKLRWILKKRHV